MPNALTAIADCERTLTNPAADRAASLSWLIHLVGDLQQSLHSGNVINAIFPAPDGDHNALLGFVSVASSPITLHWLWDRLPGISWMGQPLPRKVKSWLRSSPRTASPELTRALGTTTWSLEGRALAIDAVYQHGALAVARDARDAPPLPADCLNAARALAERRVALAAYRLADTLRGL